MKMKKVVGMRMKIKELEEELKNIKNQKNILEKQIVTNAEYLDNLMTDIKIIILQKKFKIFDKIKICNIHAFACCLYLVTGNSVETPETRYCINTNGTVNITLFSANNLCSYSVVKYDFAKEEFEQKYVSEHIYLFKYIFKNMQNIINYENYLTTNEETLFENYLIATEFLLCNCRTKSFQKEISYIIANKILFFRRFAPKLK
jgi:hypothetical protein